MAPNSEESTAKTAAVHEEEGPDCSQFISQRKRSNSPPWKKALVFDCEEQAVKVQSERDIGQSPSAQIVQLLIRAPIPDKRAQKINLPRNEKHVTIFFNETESEATTEATNPESKERNVVLATLYLDRFSKAHQILLLFRRLQLSAMYVMNTAS